MRLSARSHILLLRKHGLRPELQGLFTALSRPTWRSRISHTVFRHAPWLVRRTCALLQWLAWKGVPPKAGIASLDYRFRRSYAVWKGVREAIDWPELKELLQACRIKEADVRLKDASGLQRGI